MDEKPPQPPAGRMEAFRRKVAADEERRRQTREGPPKDLWRTFARFGLLGWSIAAPAVIGVALGRWLDAGKQGSGFWTLSLLLGGILLGCFSAFQQMAGGGWPSDGSGEGKEDRRDD